MDKNFLAMSDEDIMNMTAPPSADADGGNAVETETPAVVEEPSADTPTDQSDPEPENKEAEQKADATADSADDKGDADEQGDEGTQADNKDKSKPGDEATPSKEEGAEAEAEGADKDADKDKAAPAEGAEKTPKPDADAAKPADVKTEAEVTTPPNYEEMYNKIMTPFKANGKTIELKNPDEAIGLMQMGANYTKKMQELQPFRKILMMLQNNDLIDENKLSFLIDIEKKNPDAIHKLIKDSGVDPLTLDTESEPTYLEGSHKVSNDEVKFASTVESVGSTDAGKETLNVMKTWDDTSKELLWSHPEVMTIIHAQRETGVFQAIDTEVDRQRALGQINPETPYLEAYKIAGDHLQKTGGLPTVEATTTTTTVATPEKKAPVVLEERAAVPKSKVDNGEQANAAAPARSTTQKVEVKKNPLAMSDAEFMKQFDGRL